MRGLSRLTRGDGFHGFRAREAGVSSVFRRWSRVVRTAPARQRRGGAVHRRAAEKDRSAERPPFTPRSFPPGTSDRQCLRPKTVTWNHAGPGDGTVGRDVAEHTRSGGAGRAATAMPASNPAFYLGGQRPGLLNPPRGVGKSGLDRGVCVTVCGRAAGQVLDFRQYWRVPLPRPYEVAAS